MALKGMIGKKAETYIDPLTEAVNASASALDIFIQAGRDLDVANEKLDVVVRDEEAAVLAAQERIAVAKEQQRRNDKVKVKIDEFIVD